MEGNYRPSSMIQPGFTPPHEFKPQSSGDGGNQSMQATAQNIVQAINALAAVMAAAFPAPLTSTAAFNPPNIVAGTQTTTTVAVAGAVLGNLASASFSLDLQGITLSAYVSAADTVTVVFLNDTAGDLDLGAGNIKVEVRS